MRPTYEKVRPLRLPVRNDLPRQDLLQFCGVHEGQEPETSEDEEASGGSDAMTDLQALLAHVRAVAATASPLPWKLGQKMAPEDWQLAMLAMNLFPALLDVAAAAFSVRYADGGPANVLEERLDDALSRLAAAKVGAP